MLTWWLEIDDTLVMLYTLNSWDFLDIDSKALKYSRSSNQRETVMYCIDFP